jgi:hypothetical protein
MLAIASESKRARIVDTKKMGLAAIQPIICLFLSEPPLYTATLVDCRFEAFEEWCEEGKIGKDHSLSGMPNYDRTMAHSRRELKPWKDSLWTIAVHPRLVLPLSI